MSTIPREEMKKLAKKYIRNSYAPYSNIHVSSIAYGCGRLYPGVNVENSSYGLTICAERSAIFRMVSEGCRRLEAVLVYSEDIKPYPCGACLQVIAEFAVGDIPILVVSSEGEELYRLSELLPKAFRIKKRVCFFELCRRNIRSRA